MEQHTAPHSPSHEASTAGPSTVARWVLALALVVGIVRFLGLSWWSLWIDEALTWSDRHGGLDAGEIRNPLGYHLIGWFVDLCGGVPTEANLRFLPALAGFLSIPALFWAFRVTVGDLRAASAALLLALCSWHVYWSQCARFYTFAGLVVLLGTGIMLRALVRPASRITTLLFLVGFTIASSGAAFHPSVLLLPPACLLALVLARGGHDDPRLFDARTRRAVIVLCAISALVAAPFAWETWSTYHHQKGQDGSWASRLASMAHFARTSGFFVTPIVSTAVLLGIISAWRRGRLQERFVTLVVVLVLGFALTAAAFVRASAQYVIFLLPWILVVAVLPLGPWKTSSDSVADPRSAAPRWSLLLSLGYVVLLALPSAANVGLYFTVRAGERPPWREAYDLVWNLRTEDEPVLGMDASVGEFYCSPRATELRHPAHVGWLDYFQARPSMERARAARRAWFVVNPEQLVGWRSEDAEEFRRMLREECRLVRCWPLYVESRDLSVWVYVRE